MVFAHDTEVALAAMAALVNTEQPDEDRLGDLPALDAFVAEWRYTGRRDRDAAELEAVRGLRSVLRRFWDLDVDAGVLLVNDLLARGGALPQLVRHDGWDYHLHATPADAPLADRMAVEAAMAMVDVVRQQEKGRLRVCAADGCGNVLVDVSKNRSRRFCDATCASRTNVAAFRARRRTGS